MRWTLLSRVLRRIGGLLVCCCSKRTLPEVAGSSSSHVTSQPSAPGRESCPQQSASPTSYSPILEAACCGQLSRGSRRFAAIRSRFHPQILRRRQNSLDATKRLYPDQGGWIRSHRIHRIQWGQVSHFNISLGQRRRVNFGCGNLHAGLKICLLQPSEFSSAPPLHLERLVGFQQLALRKQVFKLGKPRIALKAFEDMTH